MPVHRNFIERQVTFRPVAFSSDDSAVQDAMKNPVLHSEGPESANPAGTTGLG